MTGDPGPYVELDGPSIWVPRTVPYLGARTIARGAIQDDSRLVYVGKTDDVLLGFTRDCFCEEECELAYRDDEPTGDMTCRVPAWHFRQEEPR